MASPNTLKMNESIPKPTPVWVKKNGPSYRKVKTPVFTAVTDGEATTVTATAPGGDIYERVDPWFKIIRWLGNKFFIGKDLKGPGHGYFLAKVIAPIESSDTYFKVIFGTKKPRG